MIDIHDSPETGYFLWAPPGRPVRVYLSHAVVRELRTRLAETTAEMPAFGGLLLGRVGPRHEGPSTVVIDSLMPVALPAGDPEQLKREIDDRPQRAVGFFRSHARPGLHLDEEDLDLFRTCFPDPSCVFLLARQGDPEQTAGFFIWEGEEIAGRSSHQEFSLAGAAPPASVAVTVPSSPPTPGRVPTRSWRKTVAIAAMLLLLPLASYEVVRALAGRALPAPAPAPAPRPQLALQSRQIGDSLELTWNPADPMVRTADHARLFISDGELRRQHWLDAAKLASGRFVYQPVTDKVDFRMELYSMLQRQEVGAAVERVRKSSPAVAKARPEPRTSLKRRRPQRDAVRKNRVAPPRPVALAPHPDQLSVAPSPPAREAAAQPAPTDTAPAEPPPTHAAVASQDRPQPASVSRVTFTLEPVPPSRLRQAIQKVPGLRVLQRSQYKSGERFVPVRTLATVLPAIPTNRTFDRDERVNVLAKIEKTGAIIEVSYEADADRALGKLAAGAVGQWRFAPALLNGATVSSKVIVHFRFSATSTPGSR